MWVTDGNNRGVVRKVLSKSVAIYNAYHGYHVLKVSKLLPLCSYQEVKKDMRNNGVNIDIDKIPKVFTKMKDIRKGPSKKRRVIDYDPTRGSLNKNLKSRPRDYHTELNRYKKCTQIL